MNNRILAFLRFYENICAFGPSRTQSKVVSKNYEISFTESEFFSDLYVPVPMEATLLKQLSHPVPGRLVAVCGPAGSGKSTVSLVVKSQLELNRRNLLIFADMRVEHSQKIYDDTEDVVNEGDIREIILSRFRSIFRSRGGRQGFVLRDDLIHFILNPTEFTDVTENQIFNVFSEDIDRADNLFKKVTRTQPRPFDEWFFASFYENDVTAIRESVSKKLDVAHYVAYIRFIDLYDRIIVWLDNVDAYSNEQQVQISSFLQRVQKGILNSCDVVVSVREENIFRIGEFKDSFNEPFPSKVSFEDPDRDNEVAEFDALNVSVISETDLSTLIRKKLDFAVLKYGQFLERQDRLRGNASAMLSQRDCEIILELSERVMNSFHAEKVILLSNNSIRDFLRIHAKFLSFLLSQKSPYFKELATKDVDNWKLNTEFLSWLHVINEPFRMETFDVMEETTRFLTGQTNKEVGCFLPYLVLTRIWNESLRLRGKHSPANNPFLNGIIRDVVRDFGYEKDEVLQVIFDLYGKIGGRSNFITFRKKARLERPDQLEGLDTTVRVTHRGKVTLGCVLCSFGYLRECSERTAAALRETDKDRLVVGNMKIIARAHLKSLQNIRDTTFKTSKNWFTEYLVRYGMPLEHNFVRIPGRVGTKLEMVTVNRSLLVPAILFSLQSYFKHKSDVALSETRRIDQVFQNYLKGLIHGEHYDDFDF